MTEDKDHDHGGGVGCPHLFLQMIPHANHRFPVQASMRGHQHLWIGQHQTPPLAP